MPVLPPAPFAPAWRKSVRSGANLGCVETARLSAGTVGVRDSKNVATSPVLRFGQAAFRQFIAGVKDS